MAENAERPVPFVVFPAIAYPSSTGMPGSRGIGFSPQNLSELATGVVVTTPGASSVPPQPTTTVDIGDSGVPSQVQQFVPGHVDLLTGDGSYLGASGIGHGSYSSDHGGLRP